MRQTTSQVIEKLNNEFDGLRTKITALETFMVCKDFLEIPGNQRLLLAEQGEAMNNYKDILMKRLLLLREQKKCEDKEAKEEKAE